MADLAEGWTAGIQTAAGELQPYSSQQQNSNKNYIQYYGISKVNVSEGEVDEISTNYTLCGMIIRHKDYLLFQS
jgi:hypothetical protein